MVRSRDFVMKGYLLYRYRGKGGEVVIPEYVRCMREGIFRDNEAVMSVVIPNTVKVIPKECFCHCTSLRRVTLPEGVRIENGAFAWCYNLKDIENLDKASYIGPHSIMATAIESITFPAHQEVIENSTLLKCAHLKSVKLGENVKKICENVFYDVDSLESIHIPRGVTEIAKNFGCVPELKEFTVDENNPVFYAKDGVLYRRYKKGDTLVRFPENKKDVDKIIIDCYRIGSGAFNAYYAPSADIIISDNVKVIEDVAFRDTCVNSITIGRGVESIAKYSLIVAVNKPVTVYVYKGSYAESAVREICKENEDIILCVI